MPAEKTTTSASSSTPSDERAAEQPAAVRSAIAGDRHPAADGQVLGLDEPPQQRAAALVDLHRHQPRRDLDDLRRQPEQPQRLRGLQPEQPAADDHGGAPPGAGRDGRSAAAVIASRSSSVR